MVRLNVTAVQKDSETQQQTNNNNAHTNSNNNNNYNNNNNESNNLRHNPRNRNNNNNNGPSTTSSTSSLNSNNTSSSVEQTTATTPPPPLPPASLQLTTSTQTTYVTGAASGIVMVVPQQAQPQPQQLQQQQHQYQQQQCEQNSTTSLSGSPPLLQQAPTPPQGAQIGPPVCAVHHPQQHQQQQLAIVAAIQQAHLAATGGGMPPLPPQHSMHHVGQHGMHGPPPPPHVSLSPPNSNASQQQQQQQQQPQQHSQHSQHAHENSHGAPGVSPSGSTGSSVSSLSSSGGNGGGSSAGSATSSNPSSNVAVATPTAPPPAPPPGPLYIQYPGEFFPTEYYIAPHPHEGICPQHSHHHQAAAMCAMQADYGPTAVQMVSQNRPPPMPVPVQVPQGQVMQQYVNESGTLMVLTPQQYQQMHAGQGHIHAPFLTTNGTSHFYSPLPAGFPGNGPPHYHAMPGGHLQPPQQQAPPQQQQTTSQQSVTHSPHSPSPPNSYHKDERSQRQHTKLIRKLEKQREFNSALSTPAHSPSPRRNELNGHHNHNASSSSSNSNSNNNNNHTNNNHQLNNYARRVAQRNGGAPPISTHLNSGGSSGGGGASSVGTSEDGEDTSSVAEDEEDYQSSIVEQLSAIQKPEVIDVTSRSAKIIWEAPAITDTLLINTRALRYNVLLSDRAKECKYKSLYKGESYDCIVQDLQPGQEYVVRLQVHYEKLQGTASEPTEFTTPACEPDQPLPPKLVVRTKNSIHLRWANPQTNGSPIQHYLLEFDEGKTGAPAARILRQHGAATQLHFVEAVKTKSKQYTLSKLQPSTVYNFRLAAVNEIGASPYSPICTVSTTGNPPTAPKPPSLQAVSSSTLRLIWERRHQDGDFLLQMLDRETGHGYLNVYNGADCIHECCQLRRATTYQFRLRSENEAGVSPWSNEVAFKTAPERPGRPGKPHAKGKIHGTHFRARWEPPSDNGGADILRYFLEITSGSKFERIYNGIETESICDRLQPGTTYQLRASCEGPAGLSPYSDVAHVTSEAIVPAAPPPPYYDNPPGPYAAVLRFENPDYNGGAPVLELELQLRHISGNSPEASYELIYRGNENYFVVKDLRPGQEYEAQTRAINRIGSGAWSKCLQFKTASAPPYQPEMLRVVVKSATHLLVSWQAPECNGAAIAEYHLEKAAAIEATSEMSETTTTTPTTATTTSHHHHNYHPSPSQFRVCYQGLQTSADLRDLLPLTLYYFRVNARNSAGVSKWSSLVNAKTPAAVPAMPIIEAYEFTANDVTLHWTKPACHGSPIIAYNIECGERTYTAPDIATEYTIGNLSPETTYKFRIQAINSIGPSAFTTVAKFTTLPLPPSAPKLDCTGVGHNFIKLKWGDGRNLDFTKYYVEMYVQRAKEYQVVYTGTNCMCKVNKLQERTAYTFRICAGNDKAGVGDYSDDYVFHTTATLPNGIKAPRVAHEGGVCLLGTHSANSNVNTLSSSSANYIPSGMLTETPTSFIDGLGNLSLGVPVTLEWQHSKNTFNDRIEYFLQYAIGKDGGDFKKIYRGPETKFTFENLEPGATYQFRVCPIRVTNAGEDLPGAYSSAFRYQVPQIDKIGSSLLSSAAVNVFTSAAANTSNSTSSNSANIHQHPHHQQHQHNNNGSSNSNNNNSNNNNNSASTACHGHTHHAHHSHHMHHSHNHTHHSHHNSRHGGGITTTSTTLHHRSVSASAVAVTSNNSSASTSTSNCSNSSNSSNIGQDNIDGGNNAIGLMPLGTTLSNVGGIGDISTAFASCDDPNHHHHHHHHAFHATATTAASSTNDVNNVGGNTTTLLAAASGLLSGNSTLLLNAAASHGHGHGHHHHAHAHHHAQNGAIRRYVTKLTSIYSNRKRFTDQEKAVIFMVLFLFLTFVVATLVKMFM